MAVDQRLGRNPTVSHTASSVALRTRFDAVLRGPAPSAPDTDAGPHARLTQILASSMGPMSRHAIDGGAQLGASSGTIPFSGEKARVPGHFGSSRQPSDRFHLGGADMVKRAAGLPLFLTLLALTLLCAPACSPAPSEEYFLVGGAADGRQKLEMGSRRRGGEQRI